MNELPVWVYDVVIALQKWSDEHPNLHAQYAGSDEWQSVPGCCDALNLVPPAVRDTAKAIKAYTRERE